jgi:hypothetical protein
MSGGMTVSVHLELSKKVKEKLDLVEAYKKLDSLREARIEEVIGLCRSGRAFSVAEVNKITGEINQLAAIYHLPSRRMITEQMVIDLVNRQ